MSTPFTKYTNASSTNEKIITLTANKKPEVAGFVAGAFGLAQSTTNTLNQAAGGVGKGLEQIDRYTKNVIQTLFSVEVYAGQQIDSAVDSITGGLSKVGGSIEALSDVPAAVGQSIRDFLKPVSSATGQTIGMLNQMLKDPTGAPLSLSNSISVLIDKISPNFTNRLEATFKKFKVDNLLHLPQQIVGSFRHLAALVDATLALPLSIIEDLYQGLMEIFELMADIVDGIISFIFDLFYQAIQAILDALVPVDLILEFIDLVGGLAAEFQAITGAFGGIPVVDSYINQGMSYLNSAGSMISNPQALVSTFMPSQVTGALGQVSQFTGMLRDPQALIQSLVPPGIMSQLQAIGQIPGLGFVGNMGYGFEGVMSGLKQGVVTGILDEFSKQIPILGPLLNSGSGTPVIDTQSAAPPTVDPALSNPNIGVVQGVPVQQQPPPEVLPSGSSGNAQQGGGANNGPNLSLDGRQQDLSTITKPKTNPFSGPQGVNIFGDAGTLNQPSITIPGSP